MGDTTRPRPLRAPRYTVSTMSMNSCLLFMAQLILLLLPFGGGAWAVDGVWGLGLGAPVWGCQVGVCGGLQVGVPGVLGIGAGVAVQRCGGPG